jgi:hypothetical protein
VPRPLPAATTGVDLCSLRAKGAPGPPPNGIALTAGEAASLARQFLTRPVDDTVGAQCAPHAPEDLVRFATAHGVVDVPMEGRGCPIPLVYVDGHAHILDRTLHDYLFATAAAFDTGGAIAPDVVGTSIDQARAIANRAGFQFSSIEQEPDDAVAPGTVLLQSPPAHHGGLNNNLRFLDIIVSSPATAASCVAANLVVYYDGSQGAGGSQFGGLVIRNIGPTECQLRAPITLVGLDAAGRTITNTLQYKIAPGTILTPRAPSVAPGANPPAGVFLGQIPVISDPRDGNTPNGLCDTVITPATWRLLIGAATRDLPNRVPSNPSLNTSGLPTCKGKLSSTDVTAYSAP